MRTKMTGHAGPAQRSWARCSSIAMAVSAALGLGLGAGLVDREFPVASAQTPAAATPERIDYLTLAQGAVPIRVGGAGAQLGASFEKALRAVDGDIAGFVLTAKPGPESLDTEFVYQLPSPTTFDRFAVPNVLETPSPSATFTREVEIQGSATSPTDGYATLATGTLTTHPERGRLTELTVQARTPVRWVRVHLRGGIQVMRPDMFFEFSEIVGNGTQETPSRSDRFSGAWRGRGVAISLAQDGAVVTGCYDDDGRLTGTVTGNILRALGTAQRTKVPSQFIVTVREDGSLFGVRSSNKAPFALYEGTAAAAAAGRTCPPPQAPPLGCGAVIHGIAFDFNSATMRPDSEPILATLYDALRQDPSDAITVEGHTSSEGSEQYNQTLSERRARAVRDDLVRRGLAPARVTSVGFGETRPVATNNDESGRSLNRRVEIQCR
ncbi:MAG: OmpA family protein [Vicinamibacterales bacterium]